MHVAAEKIIFLVHHIAAMLGTKNATNHIQTPCMVWLQTNINDGDCDYHADLDIKTLQIVFLTSFVLFWCSEIETSIVNGFYNPQDHICEVLHMIPCQNSFFIMTAGSHLGFM